MAGIEGISGAGMTYQGSVSTAQVKAESQSKVETSSNSNQMASNEIAKDTQTINIKETSGDGTGSAGNQGQALNQQMDQNEQIKKAVDDINRSRTGSAAEAIFGIHDKTNRVIIKIVDKKTKEVIKEYPPEKTLDMIAKVWEMAGIMVDEKR